MRGQVGIASFVRGGWSWVVGRTMALRRKLPLLIHVIATDRTRCLWDWWRKSQCKYSRVTSADRQYFHGKVYPPCAPLLLLLALVGVPKLFLDALFPKDGRPVCFFFWLRGIAVPVRIAVCRFWPAIVVLNAILQDRVRRFARFARGLLIEWLVIAPNRRRSMESLVL